MNSKHRSLTNILFFSSFYIVVWRLVDPFFLRYSSGITSPYKGFYLGINFFNKFVFIPGGLSDYTSRFLGELYYFPLVGALIATAVAYGLYWCTKSILSKSGFDGFEILRYIPSLALLAVHCFYNPQLVYGIGILSALIFVILFFQMKQQGLKAFILYTAFCVLVYYIAGANSLLFAFLVSLLAAINRRKFTSVLLYILIGGLIPLVLGRFFFNMDLSDSMSISLVFHEDVAWRPTTVKLYCGIYAFFPIAIIICSFLGPVLSRLKMANNKFLYAAKAIMPTVLVFVCSSWLLNSFIQNVAGAAYYLEHHEYSKAIESAERILKESYTPLATHVVNRSLYHMGTFGDKMFNYPQSSKSILLNALVGENTGYTFRGQNFMELGLINRAQQMIYENLEFNEGYPVVLFKLTKIFVFKGQTDAAKIILNQLSNHLIYGKKAQRLLAQLEKDPQMKNWIKWDHFSRYAPKHGNFLNYDKPEANLLILLENNPKNKMAFEFLMATYLTLGQFQKFFDNLPRMGDIGYKRIPVHFQEAILLHTVSLGRVPDLGGLKMDTDQENRFREFMRLHNMLKDNPKQATEELKAQFKGSYYLFFLENTGSSKRNRPREVGTGTDRE